MIGSQPNAVGHERALAPEKLLTMIEPVQGILQAVVGGEVKLAEAGNAETILETADVSGIWWKPTLVAGAWCVGTSTSVGAKVPNSSPLCTPPES